MEPIGGYFSLELPLHEEYHKDAIKLNTGRNCLEYILRCRQYKKVYIPFYTCDVILEPFNKLGIEYSFYHINMEFEIVDEINLHTNEALLYTNYFGLKQKYAEKLASKYEQQLIIDNTQAFFAKPLKGIDTFYTCRKFFGVPDGAYLYTDKTMGIEFERDISWHRMSFLTKRIDLGAENGFTEFREQSQKLIGEPIKRMSTLTERLMQSIDYRKVAKKRRNNFHYLHSVLKTTNYFDVEIDNETIPMIYPYVIDNKMLRNHLIQNKIFIAKYWPNVLEWTKPSSVESKISEQLLPLPCDQRNNKRSMLHIIQVIKNEYINSSTH